LVLSSWRRRSPSSLTTRLLSRQPKLSRLLPARESLSRRPEPFPLPPLPDEPEALECELVGEAGEELKRTGAAEEG